ncbi:hypothetical protein BDM02DRAFT_3189492 [Thelephora ganbajun]|uniref:Uncharacterized protein n=1 Tax=Thelephora ganbajun TaxID=370292 RepID=A0ACB6Z7X4_THEGA|nr:hypothetical protein BDM02DRAFT_3189492 [Thelephora ganbajun]
MDPVILQAENTLYQLSIYALMQGSNFFTSTLSIDNSNSPEGKSDEHPILLPSTITCVEFDVYLWFGVEYNNCPTQENLIDAILISRQWSIHNPYGYALDHFRRQFQESQIHPAVVLGVARQFGIPELIQPAVHALAKPQIPFSSWSTDTSILHHVTVIDIGVIGRMKEKLLHTHFALCSVPPVVHDAACRDKNHVVCLASWKDFWMSTMVPRLSNMDGKLDNLLWWIWTDCITNAHTPGMTNECMQWTINQVIAAPGWRTEMRIPEGALLALMVPACIMLDPMLERIPGPDLVS